MIPRFPNPFRPGAGHPPPYLAGRETERDEFQRLLTQEPILENLVLTGLRGVGKTVLLDSLKPPAVSEGWIWVGADLSESTSVSEEAIATRLCTDLAVVTAGVVVDTQTIPRMGFTPEVDTHELRLSFALLDDVYHQTPGLASDKLKAVLELAWVALQDRARGMIFAYDEAQNLTDQSAKEQYPLSLLLDVFQSLQRKGLPLMLVLTGLPTLFPKLVDARTFSERMFRVVFLASLDDDECADAIQKPIADADCPLTLDAKTVTTITRMSGGYPYFIQFICREVYDAVTLNLGQDAVPTVPVAEIERKLDTDFFAGRWGRATDRQRDLLSVIARLETAEGEFTVRQIVELSKTQLSSPFSASHVNQMLATLGTQGLVFKNRHGRYSFAVPLLGRFILRQTADD